MARPIQSGSGPDLVLFQYNWAHIYQDAVVDVSDVAEDVKKVTGDFYPQMEASTKVNGKYLAVPHDGVPNAIHWRKGWFKDAGAEKFPATFADLFTVGRKLKANGHPMGQALGHSFGDPPTWCYPLMWGYGGREVDEQGKVAINSPETIAAVKAMKDAWKDAYDESGLSWDDGSNNSAFLAEQLSATLNGASVWWKARADKMPMFDDIGLDSDSGRPEGPQVFITNNSYAVMKYSKNRRGRQGVHPLVDVERGLDALVRGERQLRERRRRQAGRDRHLEEVPAGDPGLPEAGPITRTPGWPGPYNQKAGQVQSKYIIVDMFAKAVAGDSAESAVAWAEGELKQIYT